MGLKTAKISIFGLFWFFPAFMSQHGFFCHDIVFLCHDIVCSVADIIFCYATENFVQLVGVITYLF